MSMIEYALNATPRHGLRRSVMSQLQTCSGPVALSTGAGRGQCCWPAWIRPGVRFDQRSLRLFATRTAARRVVPAASKRVIHRMTGLPAGADLVLDHGAIGGQDPRPIGPIFLRHGVSH